MPLTDKAVEESLVAPDGAELRIKAARLTHPLLAPVTLDTSNGLSPDEAAVLAVILNPGLRAERDRKGIAEAETLKAGILPNPRLSYSVEIPVAGTKPETVNAYGLGLGWDIKALITRTARLSAAKSHSAGVELEAAWREWQVAMRTRLWLYRLFLAKERAGLEAEHTKTLEKIYALTKGGLGLGLKTSVDLMEARSALTESRMALIKARGVIAAERLTLNRLIGFPPDRRTAPEKDLNMPFFGKVPSLPELIEGLDNRRLDIRALGLGYKSEEARLRAAVLSQFPAINIGALSARDTDGIKTAGGLFAMNIPIFNRNQGAIAVERATRKKLFDEYRTRIFEARADIARLLNNLSSLSARLEKIDKSERELQIHLNAYKHAVEKGVFDGLDYYGLQARLQEKKSEVLTLEEQGMEQAISLEIASGRYIFTDGSRQREKIKKSEEAGR